MSAVGPGSASQLLDRLGLRGDTQWTPAGELSGGERRRLQLLRWKWGHVVRSHWLVSKTAGTPWIVWRRSACRKLLGLRWGIRYARSSRRRTTDYVAEEIIQVSGRRLRHVSCWPKRDLRYGCCCTKAIRLLYPTSRGCRSVQNRSAAIQTHQSVKWEECLSGLTK